MFFFFDRKYWFNKFFINLIIILIIINISLISFSFFSFIFLLGFILFYLIRFWLNKSLFNNFVSYTSSLMEFWYDSYYLSLPGKKKKQEFLQNLRNTVATFIQESLRQENIQSVLISRDQYFFMEPEAFYKLIVLIEHRLRETYFHLVQSEYEVNNLQRISEAYFKNIPLLQYSDLRYSVISNQYTFFAFDEKKKKKEFF